MTLRANMLAASALFSLTLGLTVPSLAYAKNYAFLVGASEYKHESVKDLIGPKNDVSLMWNVLVENGFERKNIVVLADNLKKREVVSEITANGLPTHDEILTQLKTLAEKAQKGDFVYIHFSGHGALQPDNNGDEADGLDETFLPIDIGLWDKAIQSVQNAVTDDDLDVLIKIMTAKGVKIFGVFDQCNAGTFTRGTNRNDIITRAVSPDVLGVPQGWQKKAQLLAKARQQPQSKKEQGSLFSDSADVVSFFAVHPKESAIERKIPSNTLAKTGEKQIHAGVFTYVLVKAMRSDRPKSYHDLTLAVQRGYARMGAVGTPLFEGNLDQLVFGRGITKHKLIAWQDYNGYIKLKGGLLSGIGKGTVVDLIDLDPKMKDKVIARMKVVEVTASSALLKPVKGMPYDSRNFRQLMGTKLVYNPIQLALNIALPDKAALKNSSYGARLEQAIALLKKGKNKSGIAVNWVEAKQAAHYRLAFGKKGKLLFRQDVQAVEGKEDNIPYLSLASFNDAKTLSKTLLGYIQHFGRAQNLFKLADMLGSKNGFGKDLKITAYRYQEPFSMADLAKPDYDKRPCQAYNRERILKGKKALLVGATIEMRHCDILVFTMENKGKTIVDVTGLYIDKTGGIQGLSAGDNPVRLMPGGEAKNLMVQTVTWDYIKNKPQPVGLERAAFIAVEHLDDGDDAPSEPTSFIWLEQDSLPVTKGVRSGRGKASLMSQFKKATFPKGGTRGLLSATESRVEIRLMPVQVIKGAAK